MEKSRRSTKRVNYAVLDNGDHDDCEDFLPAISKKKPPKECKLVLKKTENNCTKTTRLSPAEKKLKRDIQTAINISSQNLESTKENKINIVNMNEQEDPMPGTSWGLTAKRQRKPIKTYNDDQFLTEEDFEGWNNSSDESDFSSSSQVFNNKKIRQKKKIKQELNTNKSNNSMCTAPQIIDKSALDDVTINELIVPLLVSESSNSVSSVNPIENENNLKDAAAHSNDQSISEQVGDENISDIVSDVLCAVPIVHQNSEIVTKPPKSPILGNNKISSKEIKHKIKQPSVTSQSTTSNEGRNSSNKVYTDPSTKCLPIAKSIPSMVKSFKSPIIGQAANSKVITTSSPQIGLRLGLSRKGNFKSLHPKMSIR